MCFWGCGIDVFTENGKVRKIEGNPYHPYNYGKVCARGNAGVMLLYDPLRDISIHTSSTEKPQIYKKTNPFDNIAVPAQKTRLNLVTYNLT